ncbi:MAG: DUF1700 domain-containing protein [Clostridiales bacterium]|nr:DUF1700 domain-containing protein [Clostridiales bacterium]
MNRQEFLRRLEEALQGEVSPQVLQSNLQYYQNYIYDEMRKGRSEEEILAELGDPRLIARTIADSQNSGSSSYGYEDSRSFGSRYTYEEPSEENHRGSYSFHVRKFSGIVPTLIIAAIIVLILFLLSTVFAVALKLLLSPVFWTIFAVLILWRIITKK